MMKVGQAVYYIIGDFIHKGTLEAWFHPTGFGTIVRVKEANGVILRVDASDVHYNRERADNELRGRLKIEYNSILEQQQTIKQRIHTVKCLLGWSLGD